MYPFYVTCFLIPGTAFERWLLVCRPNQAATFKNSSFKSVFYIGISFVAILVPTAFFVEFTLFEHNPVDITRRVYYDYYMIAFDTPAGTYYMKQKTFTKTGVKFYREVSLVYTYSLFSIQQHILLFFSEFDIVYPCFYRFTFFEKIKFRFTFLLTSSSYDPCFRPKIQISIPVLVESRNFDP